MELIRMIHTFLLLFAYICQKASNSTLWVILFTEGRLSWNVQMLKFVNESQGLRAWLQAIDFEFIQDSRTHGLLFLRESQNGWGMKSVPVPFSEQSHLALKAVSNQVLNISRNGDCGQSLSQLCQCLTLLTIRKIFFLCLNGFSCVSICAFVSSLRHH